MKVEVLKHVNALNAVQNELKNLRNRQMRKTLVVFGLPENKNASESLDESKEPLQNHFKACGLD